MSPPVFCPSCTRTYFNLRPTERRCPRCGGELANPGAENGGAPKGESRRHGLPTDTRELRSIHNRVNEVLADVDADTRRKVRFVITEVIAQSLRRNGAAPGLTELTVEVRENLIRVEANGRGASAPESLDGSADNAADPLAGLALFVVEELAVRSGAAAGPEPSVWYEIERAPSPALADGG